jgi:hypothetical protein
MARKAKPVRLLKRANGGVVKHLSVPELAELVELVESVEVRALRLKLALKLCQEVIEEILAENLTLTAISNSKRSLKRRGGNH